MDSSLTTKSKGKQSLSCGDLTTLKISEYDPSDVKQKNPWQLKNFDTLIPRFLKPKSSQAMDRTKSRSSSQLAIQLVNDVDSQLAEIREKLAMFREQDREFRERIDSLSSSLSELASRSSNNLTPSEISADGIIDDSYVEKQNRKGEKIIGRTFSSEMLHCIPAIKVTGSSGARLYERRRSSDPTIHEAAKLLSSENTITYGTYSTDQLYLFNSDTTETSTVF